MVILAVGLAQLPLFVDCLRTFFPKWKLTRVAGRVNNVLLFLLLGSLASVAFLYYYLGLYLPLSVPQPFTTVRGWAHIVLATWILINMVFNYLFAVFLSPGKKEEGEQSSQISTQTSPSIRCKQCDCEVLYMDHHCPFTGNCVGLENYRYFILLLIYAIAGLSYAMWMTYPYFKSCHLPTFLWFFKFTERRIRPDQTTRDICKMLEGHSLITVPVGLGIIALFCLLVWQTLMLLADTSTHSVLRQRGVSIGEACQRITQMKFLGPDSRWKVMLRQRTKWYQLIFPIPNQLTQMRLETKHKSKVS